MLNDLLDRIGGARRIFIGAIGLGAAALILVVSRLATAPAWVPAVTNVPLQSASALTDRLDQAGITYKLDQGGAEILVAESDLARARVTLAKDGLPGSSRPGLELFDRPSWGWNDFTQRVNFRRALEGELERTIGGMRGVARAEVHLAMEEQSTFRLPDERPSTASVMLALTASGPPAPDVVQGIAHLVAASVEGLAPENVSIHDETGRQWSMPTDDGSPSGLSSRQLSVQQEVEASLARKAEEIVAEVVGANNARVQVAASMNFDVVERTTHSVDPEQQALISQEKTAVTPGPTGGVSSTGETSHYDNTVSTENYSGAVGTIKRLTVAVLVNNARVPASGPTDTIPRYAPRSAADLTRIDALVRSALGVDSTRGDAVSVVNLPFEVAKTVPEPPVVVGLAERVQQVQGPAFKGAGLILAFVVALMAMRAMRAAPGGERQQTFQLAAAPAAALQMAAPSGAMAQIAPQAGQAAAAKRYNFRSADTEVRDKVMAAVDDNPDGAARLVKAWIKEG